MKESEHFTEQCIEAKLHFNCKLTERWVEIVKDDFPAFKIIMEHDPVFNNFTNRNTRAKHESNRAGAL